GPPRPESIRGQAILYSILLPRRRHCGCIPQSLRWRVLDPRTGEIQAADLGYVVGCTSGDTGRRGRWGEVKHREQLAQMRGTGFVCWRSTVVVVVLVPVQWHHVVVLVLLQWHHARIIARAASLRSENPLLSQIEKLVPDSQVICQSGKPHAFSRVARAFLLGGQW